MAHHNLVSIEALCEVGVHVHNRQAGAAMVHHSTWLENNARLKAGWYATMDIHLGQCLHTLHANISISSAALHNKSRLNVRKHNKQNRAEEGLGT